MAEATDAELVLKEALGQVREQWAQATAADGPFPLAEEEVAHFGTVQRYRCWQKGPNSLIHHTLPELYGECFTRFTDKVFLAYEGKHQTYGEVMGAAVALARAIAHEFSIPRGACVAIAARNYPEWVISFVASSGHLGCISLPVNSWWTGDELRYGLEDSKTALLIADHERVQRAPFLKELGIPAICMRADGKDAPFGTCLFEELVEMGRQLPALPLVPVVQDDTAMLMYTSGTTSKPKGVVMTQRSVMAAINMIRIFNYSTEPTPQKVFLLASPLFHVNGSHVALLQAISSGAKLVLMYKWDTKRALELVELERAETLVGVPTNTYDLINHPDFSKYDTSSLVGVGGGGAAFSAPMIKKVADKFKNARAGTGYGLTETNAVSVVMPPPFFPMRPTSCGIPVLHTDACILGENNEKLPPGEVGEICLRGAGIMKEYFGKPEKTAEAFHIDDAGKLWFRSGDVGALDELGFVFIMDRAKDIIIRGGENISCAEVEGALFEHPSIAEVAAIGVPHETLGEAVAVALVFKVGAAQPGLQELEQFARDRLAAFKVPSELYVWKDSNLPRGATGKIQKRDIRDHLADIRKGGQVSVASKL